MTCRLPLIDTTFLKFTNYSNPSYTLHDEVFTVDGYQYTVFNNSLWLKVFHHNSTGGVYFRSNEEAKRCKKPGKYSILYKIDDNFRLERSAPQNFSFLLEYLQIPQYIVWQQTSSIFDYGNTSKGYEFKYGNGTWDDFQGLHSWHISTYLSGADNGVNWFYAIGATHNKYNPYFPAIHNAYALVVDLWIEVGAGQHLNLIKTVICSLNHFCFNSTLKMFLYVFIFMEES